jgi:predicted TIM-barrel fold metal-dependent hydrolase
MMRDRDAQLQRAVGRTMHRTVRGTGKGAAMTDSPVIDIHFHLYPEARIAAQAMGGTSRAGFEGTPDEAVVFMKDNDIVAGAMCNFTPIHDMHVANLARIPDELEGEARAEAEQKVLDLMRFRVGERNEWSCGVSAEHPELITFMGIDPVLSAEELAAEVELRHGQGAKGIKLHPPVQRVNLDDERWFSALGAAERLGMTVLTHMGPFGEISGEYATVERAVRVAEAFPELRMILAHGGGPDRPAALAALNRFPHLLVDVVGLLSGPTEADPDDQRLVSLVREIGAERVLFGSDFCFRDPRPDLAHLDELDLTDAERQAIRYDNAAQLLGLA